MNKEVLSKLQTLCARGEHATYELRQRMEKWGVDQSEQDEIIDSLIANHYVDDSRYAAAFVLDKMKFNHWGERKIAWALAQKHITGAIACEALTQISDEDYTRQLRPLIKSKQKQLASKHYDDYTLRQHLVRFALQRGFTYNVIKQCISQADDFLTDEQ